MIAREMAAIEKLAVSRERIRHALMPVAEPTDAAGSSVVRVSLQMLLAPYAQSHPFALVAGAFVAGGLLASNRQSVNAVATVLAKEALPRFAPAVIAALLPAGWTDVLGAVRSSVDKAGD